MYSANVMIFIQHITLFDRLPVTSPLPYLFFWYFVGWMSSQKESPQTKSVTHKLVARQCVALNRFIVLSTC